MNSITEENKDIAIKFFETSARGPKPIWTIIVMIQLSRLLEIIPLVVQEQNKKL